MIDVDKVVSAYRGKPGCCCGCLGTHWYPTRESKLAAERCGKVNDQKVAEIVAIVNQAIEAGAAEDLGSCVSFDSGEGGRSLHVVYLTR
jgi:hypothetical protein